MYLKWFSYQKKLLGCEAIYRQRAMEGHL